jgi:hypothetical protein
MIKNKKATSIIEAIVMILILLIWIIWLYNIYTKSYRLSNSTKNKIEAIEIAREWIEAMENIRNTNWILLWADNKNCWNAMNYDNNCVWSTNTSYKINSWMYRIYTDTNWKWTLEAPWSSLTSWDYQNNAYKTFFKVQLDWNWLYTQNWSSTDFYPIFTREININYTLDTNIDWVYNANDESMDIKSIVIWQDSHWNTPHKIELETTLTNWKK